MKSIEEQKEELIQQSKNSLDNEAAPVQQQVVVEPRDNSRQSVNRTSSSGSSTSKTTSQYSNQGDTTSTTNTDMEKGYKPLSPELRGEMERDIDAYEKTAGVTKSPDGGYQPKESYLSDLFPLKENNDAIDRRNRAVAMSNALYQLFSTMSDLGIGASGGNVYQRPVNTVGQQAVADTNQRSHEEALKEADAAWKDKKKMEDVAKGVQAIRNAYLAKMPGYTTTDKDTETKKQSAGTKTSITESESKSAGTTTGRGDIVYKNNGSRSYYGSGGGGKNMKAVTVRINVPQSSTEPAHEESVSLNIPEKEYNRLGTYINAVIYEKSGSERSAIKERLVRAGIKPGKDRKYSADDLLQSGVIFDDPQLRSEFIKIIQSDDSLPANTKKAIIDAMVTYPTESNVPQEEMVKEKKSFWEKIAQAFSTEDEDVSPWS